MLVPWVPVRVQNPSEGEIHQVKKIIVIALLLVATTAFADTFKFEIQNNTNQTITQVLVSEDGETFGKFDIGKGIPSGKAAQLVWDQSTDNEECVQYFKAVFSGGDESEPVKFDFCEDELVLEFE